MAKQKGIKSQRERDRERKSVYIVYCARFVGIEQCKRCARGEEKYRS